jgi:hypothetical protein
MKRQLLLVVLMMSVYCVCGAQEEKKPLNVNTPLYEFGVSYGLLPVTDFNVCTSPVRTVYTMGLFVQSADVWGVCMLDYHHRISKHVMLGGILGYTSNQRHTNGSLWFGMLDNSVDTVDKCFMVLPTAKYYYGLRSNKFTLYSELGLGVSFRCRYQDAWEGIINGYHQNRALLAYQVTVLGIQKAWNHFGIFCELGVGYTGVYRAGIRYVR